MKTCLMCGYETNDDRHQFCPMDGKTLFSKREIPVKIEVYLHEDSSGGELADIYRVTDKKGDVLSKLLKQVTLEVEFDDEGGRVVGLVGEYRASY
jgi:hypothetical protein